MSDKPKTTDCDPSDTRHTGVLFRTSKDDQKIMRESDCEHPAYRLAFDDPDFLTREELRPVRLQLELLKPELLLDEAGIESTTVVFGSARIPEPGGESVRTLTKDAENALENNSKYYSMAREFSKLSSQASLASGGKDWVVVSGGGPGIMEAANRGAHDVGAASIALNIVLPFEGLPNPYVTPELSFQFHYFAVRKMHFLLRARAAAIFPGGFGTMDEFFELLTLVQTQRMGKLPIVLFGKDFWDSVVNFDGLVKAGTISEKDLDLFKFADSAEEGWNIIQSWYELS